MLILYMMYCCIHVTLYVLIVSPLLCNVDVMISILQKRLQDALLSLVGPSSSFRIGSHLGRDMFIQRQRHRSLFIQTPRNAHCSSNRSASVSSSSEGIARSGSVKSHRSIARVQ